jgi:hemerythrin-like domain-containing protein
MPTPALGSDIMDEQQSRRWFLSLVGLTTAALGLGPAEGRATPTNSKAKKPKPADVNATEDLMREHGVIRRTLLVYDECARRLVAPEQQVPADVLVSAARLMRRFGESYHEKLEEEQVFPPLLKAGQQKDLIQVLLSQHAAGRVLTERILVAATPAAPAESALKIQLAKVLTEFVRMYEAHAAREDTVLFPAFHSLFTEKQFDRLGDQFEDEERKILGGAGFESAVAEVAQLEQVLGIYDLAQLTPR